MLSLFILILISVEIILHRYLSTFWEQKLLPYSFGFILFVKLFILIYLINFIWMFGLICGTILFALIFFQIIYSCYLWIILVPWLIAVNRKTTTPKVNPFAYGLWSFIIIILLFLTVCNFFFTDYMSLYNKVTHIYYDNYLILISDI